MEYRERLNRRDAYIKTIKAGDPITILNRNQNIRQVNVARVTKTQIVTCNDPSYPVRFRLEDGSEITTDKYFRGQIIDPEWAAEIRASQKAEFEYQALMGRVLNFNWKNFGQRDSDLLQKAVDFFTTLEEERKTRNEKEV